MPRLLPVALLALTFIAPAAMPVFADALTYKGTLGKTAIAVELSGPVGGGDKLVGRYAYMSQGIDIPLDAQPSSGSGANLAEELPCTDKICHSDDSGPTTTPAPLGGRWHLEPGADGPISDRLGHCMRYHLTVSFCHTRSRSRVQNNSVIAPEQSSDITISAAYMLA